MPKKKPIDYCSLEPDFPQEAYLLFLFILHEGESVGMVPLDAIYRTPEDAADAVDDVIEQLGQSEHITIPEEALIMRVTLTTLFPMKQEFWKKPSLSYDQHARVKAFSPVARHPEFYSLLVTPFAYDDAISSWFFNATLPFLYNGQTDIVEQFMQTSDQVVEPRAKHSAIYQIEEKNRFNWKTKEITPVSRELEKLLGKMN